MTEKLDRRTLLAAGATASVLATLPGLAMAAPASHGTVVGPDGLPADAATRAAIVRRMRYRADAGMVFWWFRGRSYAQQGATLTPLCGLLFGSMVNVTPRGDGGFDVRQYEIGFRTDLVTGERIEKMRNPLTGEMIDIPFGPVGPSVMAYSADNVPNVPKGMGGSQFAYEHNPETFYRAADTVFLQYHDHTTVTTPGKADRVINDFGMIYSPAAQALNPHVACASAWIQGTDVTDYARWLKMPAGKGTQTLRSIGQKVTRFGDMPKDWLAMVAKVDPKLIADPMSVFKRDQAIYKN